MGCTGPGGGHAGEAEEMYIVIFLSTESGGVQTLVCVQKHESF